MKVYLLMEEWEEGYENMERVASVYVSKEKAQEAAVKARNESIELERKYGNDPLFYYVDEYVVIE